MPVFFCWGRVSLTFCMGWPWISIFPVSTYWVAGIASMSHHAQLFHYFYKKYHFNLHNQNQSLPYHFKRNFLAAHLLYSSLDFFFFCSTGIWTQGLHLEPLHQLFCVCDGFFEIDSHKLFTRAGFKTQSSWSLPPELLGLQAWATSDRRH
jgi:hypothetical protein